MVEPTKLLSNALSFMAPPNTAESLERLRDSYKVPPERETISGAERKAPRLFSQAVDPPQNISALNHPARDDAGVEPRDNEGGDRAVIRIVLADSENIYRVGIQKIFALEDDIRVIAQADTQTGLLGTIQRFPTDVILLVEGKLIASTVDAIPELVRRAPKVKIIVNAAQNDKTNTVELYRQGVQGIITRSIPPACWSSAYAGSPQGKPGSTTSPSTG